MQQHEDLFRTLFADGASSDEDDGNAMQVEQPVAPTFFPTPSSRPLATRTQVEKQPHDKKKRKRADDEIEDDDDDAVAPPTVKRHKAEAPAPTKKVNRNNGITLNKPKWLAETKQFGIYHEDPAVAGWSKGGNQSLGMRESAERHDGGLGDVPLVLLSELSEPRRQELLGLDSKSKRDAFFAKGEERDDATLHLAAMLQYQSTLSATEQRRAELFRETLSTPTEREGKERKLPKKNEFAGRYKKGVDHAKGSIEAVSKALGELPYDHDYGDDVTMQKEAATKQVEGESGYDYVALFHYGNTLFDQYKSTMEQPWNSGQIGKVKDNGTQRLAAVAGGQRALETDTTALPKADSDVYRWLAGHEDHAPGDLLSPQAFYSTSAGDTATQAFAEQNDRTLYVIHPVDGASKGRLIQLLTGSKNWYQREVLFPCYTQFVVRRKEVKPRGKFEDIYYELDELPHPVVQQGENVEGVGLESDESGYLVSPSLSTKTLVDKKHRQLFDDGGTPTWPELEAAKVERADDAPDQPSVDDVYGLGTHQRWGHQLRKKSSRRKSLTEPKFRKLHRGLSGVEEDVPYRTEENGWHDKAALDDDERAALDEHEILCFSDLSGPLLDGYEKQVKRSKAPKIELATGTRDRKKYLGEIEQHRKAKTPMPVHHRDAEGFLAKQKTPTDGWKYSVSYGKPHDDQQMSEEITSCLHHASLALEQALALFSQGVIDEALYTEKVQRQAALLQQRIVAIHPYEDGNGRISRLMMYKVLQAYSLSKLSPEQAFPEIDDPGKDQTTSAEAWRQQIFRKPEGGGNAIETEVPK